MTRDYRCGIAKLSELLFTVVDTSGLEPSIETETIQVTLVDAVGIHPWVTGKGDEDNEAVDETCGIGVVHD